MSKKPQQGKEAHKHSNGDVYDGEWENGKRQGKGTLTTSDGLNYVGDFADDKFNGKGTLNTPDGSTYVGDFVNYMFHGKGILNSPDGSTYIGDFVNDEFEGYGILTNSSAKTKYEGQFKNGQMDGNGTYTYPSGSVYTGEFLNGFPNGDGILTEANGNTLEGVRKRNTHKNENEMIGPVIYTRKNGDIYEGYWYKGNPNGSGKNTYSDGKITAGNWVNGKCVEEYPELKITKSALNGCADIISLEPIKNGDIITLHNPKIKVEEEMFQADTTIGEPFTKENTRNICPQIFSTYSFDEYAKTKKTNPTTREPMTKDNCKPYILNVVDAHKSKSKSKSKSKPKSKSRSKSKSKSKGGVLF